MAMGELGGEVEGEGGFAGGGFAGEEGESGAGDAAFPEPLDGLRCEGGEGDGG